MRENLLPFRLYFSFALGILGIPLLFLNISSVLGGFGGREPAYTVWEKIANHIYYFSEKLPSFKFIDLIWCISLSFLLFLFASPLSIFLAVKSLNSPQRKLAIFAVILNSINLIFALFIAWLLFGLARGM
jgi:uncharacterized membrane protein